MSSLFRRLLSLHGERKPWEDFTTEVVAFVFQQYPEILHEWLLILEVIPMDFSCESTFVSTQVRLPKLDEGELSNRPDMSIRLRGVRSTKPFHIRILLESKVDSAEGHRQLARYAKSLEAESGAVDFKILLYVTKHHDPKHDLQGLNGHTSVRFHEARWYTLAQCISRFAREKPDTFLNQVLQLLKEMKMDQPSRFTPEFASSMAHFNDLEKFMSEVLDEVEQRFKLLLNANSPHHRRLTQWKHHQRYVLVRQWDEGGVFEVFLGFQWLEDESYPVLRLSIGANSRRRDQGVIRTTLMSITNDNNWVFSEGPTEFFRINQDISVVMNLQAENHITACAATLNQFLDELELLKKQHPDLPWPTDVPEESVEEE